MAGSVQSDGIHWVDLVKFVWLKLFAGDRKQTVISHQHQPCCAEYSRALQKLDQLHSMGQSYIGDQVVDRGGKVMLAANADGKPRRGLMLVLIAARQFTQNNPGFSKD
jgi:hypothetical protein